MVSYMPWVVLSGWVQGGLELKYTRADNRSNIEGRAQFLYTRERCGKGERQVVENKEGEENNNKDKTSTVKSTCWKSSYHTENSKWTKTVMKIILDLWQ